MYLGQYTYRISHAKVKRIFVLEDEVFVRELFTVDGFSSSAVELSKVSSLFDNQTMPVSEVKDALKKRRGRKFLNRYAPES
jgi:hypothetical protein